MLNAWSSTIPLIVNSNETSKYKKNLLKVAIYFDSLTKTDIEEFPAYTVNAKFSLRFIMNILILAYITNYV